MNYSRLSQLSKSASNDDKINAFIQDMTGKFIVSVVSESNKYCYKCFDGTIGVIDMDFANDCAGII
jgi:hypothetical protein